MTFVSVSGIGSREQPGRVGLAADDLIVAAAGQPARTVDDLSGALQAVGASSNSDHTDRADYAALPARQPAPGRIPEPTAA